MRCHPPIPLPPLSSVSSVPQLHDPPTRIAFAEFEARRLNAPAIDPTHLLLGLYKAVDLDLPSVVSKGSPDGDEVLEELLREIRRLKTVFQVVGLDAKRFRRRLRRASPERRFSIKESGRLRRSATAKQVFADAEHFAQLADQRVHPVHLLYATLLAEDKYRDDTLVEFEIEKRRLLAVVKREVLSPQLGSASSRRARMRWN